MPTTTNYGWTTPADTDLVKDGASAIRTLGTAIDTTVFNNASAAIAKTIVDAKGDIIAATAADTVSRLAVGANDTVLTADSSTATGLKWATPASGGMTLLSTTTLSGSSVTISSIAQTYNNLHLVVRNFLPSSDGQSLRFQVNGVTTAVYKVNFDMVGNGNFSDTNVELMNNQDNGTANGLMVLDLYNYANTTTWKNGKVSSIGNDATTPTNFRANQYQWLYGQTSAISSVTFYVLGGTFTSGTVLIYGVK